MSRPGTTPRLAADSYRTQPVSSAVHETFASFKNQWRFTRLNTYFNTIWAEWNRLHKPVISRDMCWTQGRRHDSYIFNCLYLLTLCIRPILLTRTEQKYLTLAINSNNDVIWINTLACYKYAQYHNDKLNQTTTLIINHTNRVRAVPGVRTAQHSHMVHHSTDSQRVSHCNTQNAH